MASRSVRPIRIEGNVAYVPLTRGYEAVIDAADAPFVSSYNWHALGRSDAVYAARENPRGSGRQVIYLHRLLTGAPDDMEVDHIDGDRLNNRRVNMRIACHAENLRNQRRPTNNTSGFKGVSWSKRDLKWRANIKVGGKQISVGYFDCREAAHAAYQAAAKKLFGEFARVESPNV